MRILVVGSGSIGVKVAGSLVEEGHDVVLLDHSSLRQAQLDGSIDCQLVTGNATSPSVLTDILRGCGLVVAVTGSDEVNLVVCRLAQLQGVPTRLARLRNPEFTGPRPAVDPKDLGVDAVFSPEGMAVDLVERVIAAPGAVEAASFADGRLSLLGFPVLSGAFVGPLSEVGARLPEGCQVVALKRGAQALIPSGADHLAVGDVAYVLGPSAQAGELTRALAPGRTAARTVVIFGARMMGIELAQRLRRTVRRVVMFSPDPTRAQAAAIILDPLGIEVIEGSVLDLDLLRGAGVEDADYLVTLSDDDENNLMAALLCRQRTRATPILMTQKNQYVEIFELLGFPLVIEPRALATSAILRFLRGGPILALARLHHDDIEVIELSLGADSPLVGRPLGQIRPPVGMRVAAVVDQRSAAVATGRTVLTAGQRVVIVVDSAVGRDVRRWLG
ncbi:MAG: Trk system potassium transporter TrkA [Planctomycetes bacterium]|nr:Trk system potassium transporter TrkA [Planctomycetota bacterium]